MTPYVHDLERRVQVNCDSIAEYQFMVVYRVLLVIGLSMKLLGFVNKLKYIIFFMI